MSTLQPLDQKRVTLQALHPGWNIWYVPHSEGGVTWCAQPKPLINTDSAEHLSEEIRQAERDCEPTAG